MRKIEQLLEKARIEVIGPLRMERSFSDSYLAQVAKEFADELKTIWNSDTSEYIKEEDKFTSEDIYGYPLEVMFLLHCFPKMPVSFAIAEMGKWLEYLDFYEEDYPLLSFEDDIYHFYYVIRFKLREEY